MIYRLGLAIILFTCCFTTAFAQSYPETSEQEEYRVPTYAHIQLEPGFWSGKLGVSVDLGNSEEQLEEGKRLSNILSQTRSYAAVLNYMAELGYELINTLNITSTRNGSSGSYAIVYIMRKVETY